MRRLLRLVIRASQFSNIPLGTSPFRGASEPTSKDWPDKLAYIVVAVIVAAITGLGVFGLLQLKSQ
jgi:hypothetical protein